jgi:protein SCO1/2
MSTATTLVSRRGFLKGRAAESAPSRVGFSGRFVGPAHGVDHGFTAADRATGRWPDVTVRTHRDEPMRIVSDLVSEQRVLFGFIYTRCDGVCPATTANMAATYRLLKERDARPFRFISVSIDPERDTPDDLLRYAARHGLADLPDWHFVVARPEDTLALRRALRITDPNPERDRVISNHSGLLLMGNDRTNRWGGIPSRAEPIHIANTFERIARAVSLQEFAGFGKEAS